MARMKLGMSVTRRGWIFVVVAVCRGEREAKDRARKSGAGYYYATEQGQWVVIKSLAAIDEPATPSYFFR